ncbi:ATP-binding protein [Isoptericola variabilis]|uniref:ATP-binding region ATPase domain protein n=1 Tax=Isoptericola variabilis (strain 225) TaxID=743718 RepID=F6FU88_ISOV2|nr:ATP-binding protein [Isoptericola variabilis]AEG43284.1 ATP-binding region ATPase domain protein [Isoptericola variabilis 225]TWH35219.1 histidine kinase-like protein [Isoptericola variabilis J7]
MTLLEAAPPAELTEVEAWTVCGVDDVAHVRARLEDALAAAPGGRVLDAKARDRIILVASELATNAVRHGSQPVTLRLLGHGSTFVVDVVDHRPDAPPVVGTAGAGTGGFGLILAARAAKGLGWFRAQGAKHVWAQFA